jgi:hypothetical protein
MCPVIEGADLSSVSTKREPLPEHEYVLTYTGQELEPKQLILKMRVDEPAEINGSNTQGREHWEFINLVQNDGKQNKIGWTTIKRHLEAVFGEGSNEAEANPPDTDVLNGHSVRAYMVIDEYKPKDWKPGDELAKKNKIKKLFPV